MGSFPYSDSFQSSTFWLFPSPPPTSWLPHHLSTSTFPFTPAPWPRFTRVLQCYLWVVFMNAWKKGRKLYDSFASNHEWLTTRLPDLYLHRRPDESKLLKQTTAGKMRQIENGERKRERERERERARTKRTDKKRVTFFQREGMERNTFSPTLWKLVLSSPFLLRREVGTLCFARRLELESELVFWCQA